MSSFLSYAFRPFFSLLAIYALIAIPLWLAVWMGKAAFPIPADPMGWHAHEMLFGVAAAAVAGFLLTAVATWTKRPPISGAPLALLAMLWLAGRAIPFLYEPGLLAVAAVCDIGFNLLLTAMMFKEVFSVKNSRNYKIVFLLALLAISNILFYANIWLSLNLGRMPIYAGIWIVIMLLNTVGGRIIPAFTGNWLRRQAASTQSQETKPGKTPIAFNRFDASAVCLTALFAITFTLNIHHEITGLIAIVAAGMQFWRVFRWSFLQVLREPLLWVLHSGFMWIPVGLLLLGLADFGLLPASAGLHALTSGAITLLIVGVGSRAALGHTNRPLQSSPLLSMAFVLLHFAALLRVTAAMTNNLSPLLHSAGLLWVIGFALFLWVYFPILTKPAIKN